MIHLYCGDGKGKTTASCGLALRGAGSGMRVLFVQFFKNGDSSEVRAMSSLESIDTCHPTLYYGRYKTMTEEQREAIRENYSGVMREVFSRSANYGMVILDEAVSAYSYEMIGQADLLRFLRQEGEKREIILTGRNPAPELLELADYVTEMRKVKHPFDEGVLARRGIEY